MDPTTDHERGTDPDLEPGPRRFRRSADRQLGGVAKGMADYVGVDPLFFRIGFVVLAFASGVGIFAYIGAWLLVPDEHDTDQRPLALTANVFALIAGFATLVIGSVALTAGFDLDLSVLVPLLMVVLGIWVLNQRRDPDTSTVAFASPPPGTAPAPPADPHVVPPPPATPPPPGWAGPADPVVPSRLAGPAPGSPSPSATDTPPVAGSPQATDTPSATEATPATGSMGPAGAPSAAGSSAPGGTPAGAPDQATDLPAVVPRSRPGVVGAGIDPGSAAGSGSGPTAGSDSDPATPTSTETGAAASSAWTAPRPGMPPGGGPPRAPAPGWAHVHPDGPASYPPLQPPGPPIVSITMAAAIVVIGALLVVRNLGGVDVDAGLFLGGVLAVVGLGIVVSAFTRRALVLMPIAVFLALSLAFSPLIDTTATGGVGARDITVTTDDLQSSYSLGAGEMVIDFRDLELTEDRRVEIDVGAGYAEIRLPRDLPVRVEATNQFGYLEILGVVEEGVANKVTVVGEPDNAQAGTLTLVPSVTFGYVEVSRG